MIRFEAPLLLFCLLLPLLLLLAASRRSGTPMGSSLLSLWREQPDSGPSAPRRWHAPPIALLLLCGALCAAVLALAGPHRSADAAVRITVLLDDSPSMQLEQRQVRLVERIEEWARANGVLLEWRREAQPDWAAHDSAECLWAADALECRPERAGLVLSGARCVPGAVGREGADRLIYDGRELLREKGAYPPERRSVRVRGAMPAALQPLWAIWCEKQALVVNAAAREPLLELVFPAAVCAADREWIGPGFAARVGLAERPGPVPVRPSNRLPVVMARAFRWSGVGSRAICALWSGGALPRRKPACCSRVCGKRRSSILSTACRWRSDCRAARSSRPGRRRSRRDCATHGWRSACGRRCCWRWLRGGSSHAEVTLRVPTAMLRA